MAKAHFFHLTFFLYFLLLCMQHSVKALTAVPTSEVKECKLELGRFWSRSEHRIPPTMFILWLCWRSWLCFQSQCEEAGAGMC